ncbi:uncharacterized protein ColSpa_12684 [Colletotrichum spaethianum]|uniref:Uncharacterized protein n=1 Tax=Colletotrichum spaethianum TaxID=700344 RepID=A0AA37UTS8_9PEZI|nr:uncharacterized protein ColSpa_12684 [Colletotrichum spaethianum]GKT52503.1 hypothetical protein ColSpa_12684 [Colletotrichum spaethianum]
MAATSRGLRCQDPLTRRNVHRECLEQASYTPPPIATVIRPRRRVAFLPVLASISYLRGPGLGTSGQCLGKVAGMERRW